MARQPDVPKTTCSKCGNPNPQGRTYVKTPQGFDVPSWLYHPVVPILVTLGLPLVVYFIHLKLSRTGWRGLDGMIALLQLSAYVGVMVFMWRDTRRARKTWPRKTKYRCGSCGTRYEG
jgi:hypothetical protein